MKKAIIIPIIVLMLLSSFTIVSSALSFEMTLSPAVANVPPGQTVDIYLSTYNLNVGSDGMNLVSCILNYDSTIFEEITTESITGLNGWNLGYDSDEQRILIDRQGYVKEDGQLCKITFKVKSTITEGTTEISITNPQIPSGKLLVEGTGSSATINIKQISSEKYNITEDNKITGVELETTVDNLKNNIVGSENATIKNANGTVLTSDAKIGTGTTIEIPGEEPFTVIVKGDVDGDGVITMLDIAKMQLHAVKIETLQEPYATAADIDGLNGITMLDLAKVLLHYVGIEKIVI